MQTTAIRTVASSLPENMVILLTLLISTRYIPYTDLPKILVAFFSRADENYAVGYIEKGNTHIVAEMIGRLIPH